jgi:4-hydroxy-3-polyprenylbenzoate decarboxylase
MKLPLVLAITGASGAVYATRLLAVMIELAYDVHLVVSPSGRSVIQQELGIALDLDHFDACLLLPRASTMPERSRGSDVTMKTANTGDAGRDGTESPDARGRGNVYYHHYEDYFTPIASGSFLTAGMVICPCSGSTMSAIAHGASDNLIQRAADVHLKERRKLIVVPRETPLSIIQLDNMKRACEAGAVVLPAMPGWYHGVQSLNDIIDFVVARILDQLGIAHSLMRRWGEGSIHV